MRSTKHLIDALTNYGWGLDAGCETTSDELYQLEEALASLLLKVQARTTEQDPAGDSQAGADAADTSPDPYDDRMPAESMIYPGDR